MSDGFPLFTTISGTPLYFKILCGPSKKHHYASLIQKYGGIVKKAVPSVRCLLMGELLPCEQGHRRCRQHPPFSSQPIFQIKWVVDCIKENEFLDIGLYILNPSPEFARIQHTKRIWEGFPFPKVELFKCSPPSSKASNVNKVEASLPNNLFIPISSHVKGAQIVCTTPRAQRIDLSSLELPSGKTAANFTKGLQLSQNSSTPFSSPAQRSSKTEPESSSGSSDDESPKSAPKKNTNPQKCLFSKTSQSGPSNKPPQPKPESSSESSDDESPKSTPKKNINPQKGLSSKKSQSGPSNKPPQSKPESSSESSDDESPKSAPKKNTNPQKGLSSKKSQSGPSNKPPQSKPESSSESSDDESPKSTPKKNTNPQKGLPSKKSQSGPSKTPPQPSKVASKNERVKRKSYGGSPRSEHITYDSSDSDSPPPGMKRKLPVAQASGALNKVHREPQKSSKPVSGIVEIDSDDEFGPPPGAIVRLKNIRQNTRDPYTVGEETTIIRYLLACNRFHGLRSNVVWKEMDGKPGIERRTWQSLREHFLKKMLHKLEVYDMLTKEQIHAMRKVC